MRKIIDYKIRELLKGYANKDLILTMSFLTIIEFFLNSFFVFPKLIEESIIWFITLEALSIIYIFASAVLIINLLTHHEDILFTKILSLIITAHFCVFSSLFLYYISKNMIARELYGLEKIYAIVLSLVFVVAILTIGEFVSYSLYFFPKFQDEEGLVYHLALQGVSGIYVASSGVLIAGLFFSNSKMIKIFKYLVMIQMCFFFAYAILIYFTGNFLPCRFISFQKNDCLYKLCDEPLFVIILIFAMAIYKGFHVFIIYSYIIRFELESMTKKAQSYFAIENRENACHF
ncbi:hypothetical protein PVAND_016120 [Polypedilum vanderplanki]|uniref:Uncharacterized protein n=1 Tax=Polypedilum vanderplanki TaxID=319348 RepID=A0A9J6BEN9_POLVA|nr:hypothetical protein PVAND_016120 [Polypedilum vanderplanki]